MTSKSSILLAIVLVKGDGVINWLHNHLLTCPMKKMVGIDCPGCGFQRSVLALFSGNFEDSFIFYPATVPIFSLLIFTAFHLKFDFKKGAFIIKMIYIGIIIIIAINYIYKIFTNQLI